MPILAASSTPRTSPRDRMYVLSATVAKNQHSASTGTEVIAGSVVPRYSGKNTVGLVVVNVPVSEWYT
jgi:hypothetical protein